MSKVREESCGRGRVRGPRNLEVFSRPFLTFAAVRATGACVVAGGQPTASLLAQQCGDGSRSDFGVWNRRACDDPVPCRSSKVVPDTVPLARPPMSPLRGSRAELRTVPWVSPTAKLFRPLRGEDERGDGPARDSARPHQPEAQRGAVDDGPLTRAPAAQRGTRRVPLLACPCLPSGAGTGVVPASEINHCSRVDGKDSCPPWPWRTSSARGALRNSALLAGKTPASFALDRPANRRTPTTPRRRRSRVGRPILTRNRIQALPESSRANQAAV